MKRPKEKYAWTATVGEKDKSSSPSRPGKSSTSTRGTHWSSWGDESKGLAIPPKSLFARFAAAIFETEQAAEEGED